MCEYLPVRTVARLGPQIELGTRQRSKRIPSLAEAVDVRRLDQPARVVVGADRLVGVVVAENEEDVGALEVAAPADVSAAATGMVKAVAPIMNTARRSKSATRRFMVCLFKRPSRSSRL